MDNELATAGPSDPKSLHPKSQSRERQAKSISSSSSSSSSSCSSSSSDSPRESKKPKKRTHRHRLKKQKRDRCLLGKLSKEVRELRENLTNYDVNYHDIDNEPYISDASRELYNDFITAEPIPSTGDSFPDVADITFDIKTNIKHPTIPATSQEYLKVIDDIQRFDSSTWSDVRYAETQKQYNYSPGFTDLETNEEVKAYDNNLRHLIYSDKAYAAITFGILKQKEVFLNSLRKLISWSRTSDASLNNLSELVEELFLKGDFHKVSTDLLQMACGHRAEAIEMRRDGILKFVLPFDLADQGQDSLHKEDKNALIHPLEKRVIKDQNTDYRQFQAGRLAQYASRWKEMGAPEFILQIITGYRIPFQKKPPLRIPDLETDHYRTQESEKMTSVIYQMKSQGVLEVAPLSPSFVSPLFLIPKSDGSDRPIFNLRRLNQYVQTDPFRLINMYRVPDFIQPQVWMCKVDLSQAYFNLPINQSHRRFLRLLYKDEILEHCENFRMPYQLDSPNITREKCQSNCLPQRLSPCSSKSECFVQTCDYANGYSRVLRVPSQLRGIDSCPSKMLDLPRHSMGYSDKSQIPTSRKICSNISKNEPDIKIQESVAKRAPEPCRATKLCQLCCTSRQIKSQSYLKVAKYIARSCKYNKIYSSCDSDRRNALVASKLQSVDTDTCPSAQSFPSYRCFGLSMGCAARQLANVWHLESRRAESALQCEGNASHFKSPRITSKKPNSKLNFDSDRQSVCSSLPPKRGGTKSQPLAVITQKILRILDDHQIHFKIFHIPGKLNNHADCLSRHRKTPEWHLLPHCTQMIFAKMGIPVIDLFASRSARVVDNYATLDLRDQDAMLHDAFSIVWNFPLAWIFPPPFLIPRVLMHLNQATGIYLIVVPLEKSILESRSQSSGHCSTIHTDKPEKVSDRHNNRTTSSQDSASRTVIAGWIKSLMRQAGITATPGSAPSTPTPSEKVGDGAKEIAVWGRKRDNTQRKRICLSHYYKLLIKKSFPRNIIQVYKQGNGSCVHLRFWTPSNFKDLRWLEEEAAAKASGRQPSFWRALFKTFFWSYIPGGIMQFGYATLRTLTPLLYANLLLYWSEDSTINKEKATYYAIGMILFNWVGSLFNHHGNLYCRQFGMKLRIATSSLIFRKIMRINIGTQEDTAAGKVVNLLSNDLQRFDLAFHFLHYVWIIPLQLIVVCYLGFLQAGAAALIGLVAIVIIAMPIQGILSRGTGKVRIRVAEKTDARIKLMSEVISGIQVIKMYAWEIPFEKMVSQKRKEEMKEIRIATALRTAFHGFLMFTERAALFITILTLMLLGKPMTANVIYPLQQLMNSVHVNITVILPLSLSFISELYVSVVRVEDFLTLQDRPDLAVSHAAPMANMYQNYGYLTDDDNCIRPLSYHRKSDASFTKRDSVDRKYIRSLSQPAMDIVVELRDVSASWTEDTNFLALKNVSMRIRRGKLCAIIGAVGSGKSSILQLLLKELTPITGSVSVQGKLSYASQEAWLFPSTVRENILFGLPYDQAKYRKVCRVCALEKDFFQFPFGDQTLVGERGVSLGGQRARINLARSVYREADIYLLDDPLSAVDANVGRQLFDGCINGYLQGRTRILVTHQLHFLKAADYIVVLNEGQVENMGTFDELVASGKQFTMMLMSLDEGKDKDTESVTSSNEDKPCLIRNHISINEEWDELPQFEVQKMADEERQSGNLRWEVVSTYLKFAGSSAFVIFAMLTIFLTAVCAAATDYWISYWSNQMAKHGEELSLADMDADFNVQVGRFTMGQYLLIHGCLVLVCILFTNLRVLPFVSLCISATKKLHDLMFATMIKGVMRFFDTSSSGRILNRFTKDMGALDEILPRALMDVLQIYSSLVGILVLNAIVLYWTLIPSLVLLFLFFIFVKIYLKTAQGVKRLEGTTKSPVFGMVTSSLNGIVTIRSTGAQQRLIEQFDEHQDLHTSAWNGHLAGGSTFGVYLDTMCLIYITCIIFVFIYVDFGSVIPMGSVGLAVSQSNTLMAMLQFGARMLVECIAQLTSVERVLEYTRIDTEPDLFQGQITAPPQWPSKGRIEFQRVFLRYVPDEAPVLKDINIVVESGWKVGIVGRTGAGKSSLISALFRFAYIDGVISVDDVDTSLIGRQELRSKISIIPQEPVLFSASIRYNLDPFDIYSDSDIWRALEQVDMKSAIPSLDYKVTEAGSNFSIGQRQLMCLARAVLKSNKILIMDEATANVDPKTDNFIQRTIRRQFSSCTVLTIAHRLNTIMDSDRVLVMNNGQVAEYDHPYILLSDPNSALSLMVRETGEKNRAQLFQIAKGSYFQSNLKENAR
ncbi:LOW QUALITY PROTEIN: ATP-binding cassette subfamily C member 4-like [Aphomia sociella]